MSNAVQNLTGGGRIDYIDLAKGFCIMLVVGVHTIDFFNIDFPAESFFVTFRMPLYFFLSGLFFKRYEDLKGFTKRKTNKLLIPFLFFYLLTGVLFPNAMHWAGFDLTNSGFYGIESLWAFITPGLFFNAPIWFLVCLFWVNMLFYCIVLLSDKFTNERIRISLIITLSALCGFCGWLAWHNGIDIWAFIDTALSSTPFFCMGYLVRKYTPILTTNKSDKYLPLLLIAAGVITYLCSGGMSFLFNKFDRCNPFIVYIGGFFGTLMVMFLAKMIKRLPFVSYWGRYSIIILCTHNLPMQVISRIFVKIGLPDAIGVWPAYILAFLITMFSYQLIIPLCIKFIPWFTAQKDLIPIPKIPTPTQQSTPTNQ